MYLTIIVNDGDTQALFGLTHGDRTGDEFGRFTLRSIPVTDLKNVAHALDDLDAYDWRTLTADPDLPRTPDAFRREIQARIDLDDAEQAEHEAAERQHAQEFRMWQEHEYGMGV